MEGTGGQRNGGKPSELQELPKPQHELLTEADSLWLPPGSVPKSCIPPDSLHRNAVAPLSPSDDPTTWPASLMAEAWLEARPGSVPKPRIPATAVQRNARRPAEVSEKPTASPAALSATAWLC